MKVKMQLDKAQCMLAITVESVFIMSVKSKKG